MATMNSKSQAIRIDKIAPHCANTVTDEIAVEEPLEIRLGFITPDGRTSRSISITMRTPGNDAELAAGFLLSESIIRSANDIASIEHSGPVDPSSGCRNIIRVDLAKGVAVDLERLQRHFYTTSSCGVCGKSSLDALRSIGTEPLKTNATRFDYAVLCELPDKLRELQETFDKTGGLHAAAAFDSEGNIVLIREDVGRHNAVDKVIGALLMENRLPAHELGLLVSGRASFELMQKTLVAGMPLLAAVSAPSSLAVRLARDFNVSLIGFLRGDTFNVYAGRERIS